MNVTETQYRDLARDYASWCSSCGDMCGPVEPDAREYICDVCHDPTRLPQFAGESHVIALTHVPTGYAVASGLTHRQARQLFALPQLQTTVLQATRGASGARDRLRHLVELAKAGELSV